MTLVIPEPVLWSALGGLLLQGVALCRLLWRMDQRITVLEMVNKMRKGRDHATSV